MNKNDYQILEYLTHIISSENGNETHGESDLNSLDYADRLKE